MCQKYTDNFYKVISDFFKDNNIENGFFVGRTSEMNITYEVIDFKNGQYYQCAKQVFIENENIFNFYPISQSEKLEDKIISHDFRDLKEIIIDENKITLFFRYYFDFRQYLAPIKITIIKK